MIGPQHRTQAYAPAVEAALAYTAAGQADFADLYSPFTCFACVHWRASRMKKGKGRCDLFRRRMRGREGAMLQATQQACRAFEALDEDRSSRCRAMWGRRSAEKRRIVGHAISEGQKRYWEAASIEAHEERGRAVQRGWAKRKAGGGQAK
jgi:hypothetical protein